MRPTSTALNENRFGTVRELPRSDRKIGAAHDADEVYAYLVLSDALADKPLSNWRLREPGRWVSGQAAVIYASMSPAAALLEALAKHGLADDPRGWWLATLCLPRSGLLQLAAPHESWRERPYRTEVRAHGDHWASARDSLALRVPSAICPDEYNVLINLGHPGIADIRVESVRPLQIDPRL